MPDTEIYLIPGLGFDCRIFRHLDWGAHPVVHLNWIEPEEAESLTHYARRMAAGLEGRKSRKIIVGHSFGGILAREIATLHTVEKVILISSIKSCREQSPALRAAKWLRLHRLFSKTIVRRTFPLWAKKHGYESPEEQALFLDMIEKQSDHYLKWALKTLSNWSAREPAENTPTIHLHGDSDRTFPFRQIGQPCIMIPGGNHFMVFNKAGILNEIIRKEIGPARAEAPPCV